MGKETVKGFRKDINGLRAWAVVMVIFYHFGAPLFSGGFVGVDVFFVISGFLMTGIIVGGLEKQTAREFSVWDFYMARAKRIIPALVVLCAVLMMVGWFFLPAFDYSLLGKHVFSALSFVSNIAFWREAGYFDAASHDKWLLHTWSLSVEWQFYAVLPLALLAIWKLRPGRSTITRMIVLGLVASFALSVYVSLRDASAAFYLFPMRAWEMLAGGLVYMLSGNPVLSAVQRKLVEWAGFCLIMAAVLLFDASTSWPGWRALVPVVGAVLVLVAARQDSLCTGTGVAQWLGNCSYSLYLWHWPIVVALAYLDRQNQLPAIIVGLISTLVLGHISYRFVENQARINIGRIGRTAGFAGLVTAALVVAVPGLLVRQNDGIHSRLPESISNVTGLKFDRSVYREGSCFLRPEQSGDGFSTCVDGMAGEKVVLWGDSHAAHLYPGFKKYISASLNLVQRTAGGCPPIIGMDIRLQPHCKEVNDTVSRWIASVRPERVVLAANWMAYDWRAVSRTIRFLRDSGVKVVDLVGPVPQWRGSLPGYLEKLSLLNGVDHIQKRLSGGLVKDVFRLDDEMKEFSTESGVNYISAIEVFCNEQGCLTVVDNKSGSRLTAWDYGHLTAPGSDYLVARFPKDVLE